MLRSLLLASRIDVLFKRMYLKKMMALFDFSFLKTGNLSRPPHDEHCSAAADAWSGSSVLWMHLKGSRIFCAFRKGVGAERPAVLGLAGHPGSWVALKKSFALFVFQSSNL